MLPAAVTSAFLSTLFLIVYSTTNWLATQRTDVLTWYFDWELAIPFVPIFIVPYMSIDLFFIAAPFLCSDRRERTVLAQRIAFAIVVAGAMFLLMPLRLAYPRPPVAGWLGMVFDAFRGFDAPHNLFPSLHIALRTILAETYARHTRGLVKAACAGWFSLIGLSTVLTYQHHVVDLAGGFVLGFFALYLFRLSVPSVDVTPNPRLGAYYAAGSLVLLALSWPLRPWGAFLLWPAGALAVTAAGYLGVGPGIYRKRDGRLPFTTRFVLAPVLLGQYLSLLYYRRQCRPWDAVTPSVWIGRQLSRDEAGDAIGAGVTAVVDLTAEFTEASPLRALHYCNVPILDLTSPTEAQLSEAVRFIADEAKSGIVYVHCKIGYSRSAAVVGAHLLASGAAADVDTALAILRQARPSIIVRSEARQALTKFAAAELSPADRKVA
jgi:membrane-associated phospholipid phosphatase